MLQVRVSCRALHDLPDVSSHQVLPLPTMALKAAMLASRELILEVRCVRAFNAFAAIRDSLAAFLSGLI